jgi:hypothetical protein
MVFDLRLSFGVLAFAAIAAIAAVPAAQEEKPVPKDSARVSVAGCAYKDTFIVARPPEGEPVRSDVQPGRRFKLHGQKATIADIRAHEAAGMIEVTGIVRKADLVPPPGISIGGRVRISPGNPQAPLGGPAAAPLGYSQAVMDVESWRPLPASCPNR